MLACLYDVHGNLLALERVLADARARGADAWLIGGDVALMGGWPRETVATLRGLEGAVWIRGNADRWLLDPPEDETIREAVADCRAALGDRAAEELGALDFDVSLAGTRFVHASPASDMRSFLPEPGDGDAGLLEGVAESRLVFGHFHIQFTRHAGAVELVGPGSVGMPLDGDHRSAYALIHDDGGVELRRVAYDWEASAARIYEVFGQKAWTRQAHGRIARARMD